MTRDCRRSDDMCHRRTRSMARRSCLSNTTRPCGRSARRPASAGMHPASVAMRPASVAMRPAWAVPHPASGAAHPASGAARPASAAHRRRRGHHQCSTKHREARSRRLRRLTDRHRSTVAFPGRRAMSTPRGVRQPRASVARAADPQSSFHQGSGQPVERVCRPCRPLTIRRTPWQHRTSPECTGRCMAAQAASLPARLLICITRDCHIDPGDDGVRTQPTRTTPAGRRTSACARGCCERGCVTRREVDRASVSVVGAVVEVGDERCDPRQTGIPVNRDLVG
jgi:hypothetical protein